MLFNSPEFLFAFLPAALAGWMLARRFMAPAAAIWWLIGASLFFYGWWNPVYLVLLCGSVAANFGLSRGIVRAGPGTGRAKALMIAGIALNLGLIAWFKYAGFLANTANALAGTGIDLGEILLPLAISFFTFQQIAFLVDAYRGETDESRFSNYALFVVFFPQLIAGPIVHHKEMMPQFAAQAAGRRERMLQNILIGLTLFAIGLFKKVVIADTVALTATPVFAAAEAGQMQGALVAWNGAFAYSMQLYFDFSGYSDMAIGLARMFGIRLPLNFNSPYKAVSIIDFWRRWHMTLSRFLRDYLYIPLGGGRRGPTRRSVNLMITMLLGGLWHGAGWTFVIWGGLHGAFLLINHALVAAGIRLGRGLASLVAARTITLLLVTIAWVFFRAESYQGAMTMLAGMANLPASWAGMPGAGALSALGVSFEAPPAGIRDRLNAAVLIALVALVWCAPNSQEIMRRHRPAFAPVRIARPEAGLLSPLAAWFARRMAWRPTTGWGLAVGAVLATALLGLSRVSEFLYFQF